MQELLSRSQDTKGLLRDQEFYELRLFDSESAGGLVYCVREAHAQWDDKDGDIMWEEQPVKVFATLQEAKTWYSERRLILAQQGLIHSVMDLL
jgi:hypothetical protein